MTVLIQPFRQSHSVFMDGACWLCFCCRHSSFQDINVRILRVCVMECMCAQTTPWFILSSDRVWGRMESEPILTPREKSPLPENFSLEEDRTQNAASSGAVSPTHYQPAIPAPYLPFNFLQQKAACWTDEQTDKQTLLYFSHASKKASVHNISTLHTFLLRNVA